MTRITIVDDHELFAETLDVALTLQGHDVRRVSLVDRPRSDGFVVSATLRQRPDVVLLDLDLGARLDGARLIGPLAAEGVKVVVLTATTDDARLGECLGNGARSVVVKSAPLNTILARIRYVAQGRTGLDLDERERLLASYRRERAGEIAARERLGALSQREQEVLGELMDGRTVVEIARSSYVSEATVRTQVRAIRTKLGVTSQLGAVGLATRAHWQPPAPREPA
jgi:DNA-binding NarL/FixJ family response regulator